MTTQQPITFEYEDENGLQRCPRCKRLPKNIADERIGFSYTCLCRCSMLGRFAIDQDDAVQNWNDCVAKEQMKMESFTDHGIKRTKAFRRRRRHHDEH